MSVEVKASPGPEQVPAADGKKLGSGTALLLAVCCVAQFMVILDLSIVNVALPSIQSDLGFSSPDLQWVVDAYAITFAGFLMLGGRVADHFGQRRTLVAGLILFGLASLAGGAAPDQIVLVAASAVQGLAGALMAETSLAIITASFPPGPKLPRAIGIWAAMNGLGGAAGVLFGGVITEVLSRRWGVLIKPPIAPRRANRPLQGRRGAAQGARRAAVRSRRRADADDRADGARLWRRRSRPEGLGHVRGARPDRARPAAARGVRPDRGPRREGAADPDQRADETAEDGEHDRAAVQRGAVPDVVRQLAVHPAGARALAASHGADLPADDADDHADRLTRGQARQPFRRAPGARQRPADDDGRPLAVHADRLARQRDRLRRDPGRAHGGGHRDVDRAFDDRRDAGREGGAGGARVGARQNPPPGRRAGRGRARGSALAAT